MKDQAQQKAVIFIGRSGIQFFSTAFPNIVSLPFDPKVVKDLDVIDPKTLQSQISTFIGQNKMIPSVVLFVFSEPSCFYQDLKETDDAKLKLLLQEFVNNVPFETVLTKVYKTRDGVRVVSVNERLYREVAATFQSKGFVSLGAIPSFVLGGKLGLASGLDVGLARHIIMDVENLRDQSFFAAEGQRGEDGKPEEKSAVKKQFKITKNFMILGVVFGLLVVVLVILLIKK